MKYLIGILFVVLLLVGCQEPPAVEDTPEDTADTTIVPEAEEAEDEVEETAPVEEEIVEAEPTTGDVKILGNDGFDPEESTITAGSSLTFTNDVGFGVVLVFKEKSTTGSVNSGLISPGETYTHTFEEAGTFEYWTTAHGKKGTAVVE